MADETTALLLGNGAGGGRVKRSIVPFIIEMYDVGIEHYVAQIKLRIKSNHCVTFF